MPYITKQAREELSERTAETSGELNYNITKVIDDFVLLYGMYYETFNTIMGVLEKVKAVFISQDKQSLSFFEFIKEDTEALVVDIAIEIEAFVFASHDTSDKTLAVLGALEGAKTEFIRRVITPYENKKCAENGDVYSCLCEYPTVMD